MNNNVLILCAVLAFIFLNGCAATNVSEGTGPWRWQYIPTTGHPADPSYAILREEDGQWTR